MMTRQPESGNFYRKLRHELDLSRHPSFGYEPNHYLYTRNGLTARLRYNQDTGRWRAKIEIGEDLYTYTFLHGPHDEIVAKLAQWIDDLTSPDPYFDEIEFCVDCGYTAENCHCAGLDDWMTYHLPRTELQNA